jgi:hypothetical protein
MKIRAVTTVAVRIFGLIALFKGAMASTNVVMLFSSLLLAASRPSGRVMALQCLGLSLGCIVPAIAGLVCIAYSKPIAELLVKGVDETGESGTAPGPAPDPAP